MNAQNLNVDNSGNVTNAQPVNIDTIISRITSLTQTIADNITENSTYQSEIDSLNAVLAQVAQAPDADPAVVATLTALPAVRTLLSARLSPAPAQT